MTWMLLRLDIPHHRERKAGNGGRGARKKSRLRRSHFSGTKQASPQGPLLLAIAGNLALHLFLCRCPVSSNPLFSRSVDLLTLVDCAGCPEARSASRSLALFGRGQRKPPPPRAGACQHISTVVHNGPKGKMCESKYPRSGGIDREGRPPPLAPDPRKRCKGEIEHSRSMSGRGPPRERAQ